jgi:chromosome segregation ATPase
MVLKTELIEKTRNAASARLELESAQVRNRQLETHNTELEMKIQTLNDTLIGLNEQIESYQSETLDLEAECEAKWESRVNSLTADLSALTGKGSPRRISK